MLQQNHCSVLGSELPHNYGQRVFPSSFLHHGISSLAHRSTNVRRALILSSNLHLLSTEDDQSAHLRPHIMFFLFFFFFHCRLRTSAWNWCPGSHPGTIVLRLPLTTAKKLQHNRCGLSDAVKPLLHIPKPHPAQPLQLYAYPNSALYSSTSPSHPDRSGLYTVAH